MPSRNKLRAVLNRMAGRLGKTLLSKGIFRNQPERTTRPKPATLKLATFVNLRRNKRMRAVDSDFIHKYFRGVPSLKENIPTISPDARHFPAQSSSPPSRYPPHACRGSGFGFPSSLFSIEYARLGAVWRPAISAIEPKHLCKEEYIIAV